jgi:hypothetical protein
VPQYARLLLVVALSAAVGGSAAPSHGSLDAAAGTLSLNATLQSESKLGACPAGVTVPLCAIRTGTGPVPGVGAVTETYTWLGDLGPPACETDFGRALAYPIELMVAGKGEIHVAVEAATSCVGTEQVRTQTQTFRIVGGSGAYAGASGAGTLERKLGGDTATGARRGTETWTGTLAVPGLEFDLVPPQLLGATSKTVRAPRNVARVRVTYTVRARDAVDGQIPVTCQPRSGARFKVGRTRVSCHATDDSANTRTARFVITVKH